MKEKKTGAMDVASIDKIKRGVDYQKRIDRIRRILILVLAGSFIIFIIIAALAIANEGAQKFFATVESINVFYFLLALLTVFAAYVMRFPKWQLYLKRLSVKIPTWKSFMIYLSMYSMDITPGRWGRAVVSYTINRLTNIKFAKTFPAVVADIFTDFLGFVVISLASAFFLHKYEIVSIVIAILLLIPFFFLYQRRPFEWFKKKLSRFKSWKSFFQVGELYFENYKLLDGSVYIYSMIYTIPSMFLNGMALYVIMLAFGVHLTLIDIPIIIFIYSSSLLLGMVTGIPGTLGVTDAALLGYLTLFFGNMGVNFGLAVAITIFFRIATVWFVQLFGSVSLLYTFDYWKAGSIKTAV